MELDEEQLLGENLAEIPATPNETLDQPAPKPCTDYKQIKLTQVQHMAKSTSFRIHQAQAGDHCKLCSYRGTGVELKKHATAHFIRYFCDCSHSDTNKDNIIKHIKEEAKNCILHQTSKYFYAVDELQFPKFKEKQKFTSEVRFGELLPSSSSSKVTSSSTDASTSYNTTPITLLSALPEGTSTIASTASSIPTSLSNTATSTVNSTNVTFASQDIRQILTPQQLEKAATEVGFKRKHTSDSQLIPIKRTATPSSIPIVPTDYNALKARCELLEIENSDLRNALKQVGQRLAVIQRIDGWVSSARDIVDSQLDRTYE